MPDDLRHEQLKVDGQKTPDAPKTQERLGPENSKADHDQSFFNRNFGVLITAATTILGISLSATQIWVAYIQSDREAQRRASENAAAQLEKSREFDFQESKDLREFIIKNYSQITSDKEDVRNNIRDLMISTYRPEIVTPIVRQLRAFSPKQQQATWGDAAVALAGFAARKPDTAWCYQEKKPNSTYGVYCHSSEANCTTAKQGSRTATACIQVSGLSETDWHPVGKGLMNSWYQEQMNTPLPPPFPQP
jgi:hypothetical protein